MSLRKNSILHSQDDYNHKLIDSESIGLNQMNKNRQKEHLFFDCGKIKFEGHEYVENNPQFIRYKTDKNELLSQMVEEAYFMIAENWTGSKPELFISVIGGFKRMDITKRQKKIFKQGLMDIMKTNRTVIITGGFNVGVHKLVGESVREFKNLYPSKADNVYLVGISTWGVVFENHSLEGAMRKPDNYFEYQNKSSTEAKKVALDPNCNYFIFCDDGTEKQYDKETNFMSVFEKYLMDNKENLLAVQILFEGGFRAISRAHRSLENKISAVVINHSGRAADLISKVLEKNNNSIDKRLEIFDREKDVLVIPGDQELEIRNCVKEMYEIYREQIFIYDMDDYSTKFANNILEAVITGKEKREPIDILNLCMQFNCVEVATQHLKIEYSTIKDKEINKCFVKVLNDDKPDFVNFFLEKDYQYENAITKTNLERLYKHCLSTELLDERENHNLVTVGKIISELSGQKLNNIYNKGTEKTYVYKDLFLWALLCNRFKLAKIFWENGKDHISSALIGSIILRNKAAKTIKRGDSENHKELINESLCFEKLALSVLTHAYAVNHESTIAMLIRRLEMWNNMSCFDIALGGELLNFLNHSACTSYTTSVWYGALSPLKYTWEIALNILLGLCLMPRWKGLFVFEKISNDGVRPLEDQIKIPIEEGNRISKCSSRIYKKKRSYFEALKSFYSAPIVKFYINFGCYITFLFIFAYLILVELKPRKRVKKIKEVAAEIYVYIYILSFALEEMRQAYDQNGSSFRYKLNGYFSGSCNKIDVFIIIFFVASVIVRWILPDDYFMICRCLYGMCFSMFCLRTLQFYFVYQFVGPKVLMIGEMIRDIIFFLSIFLLFLLSFGTLSQSMRSPNSVLNITLINNVLKLPYFQTYGEIMLEKTVDEDDCETFNCYVQYTTIIFGLALYLLLTNILLVNLLIAMFGYTFSTIHSDSRKYWSFIRLQLVMEFHKRPILSAPLNVPGYICRLIKCTIATNGIQDDDNNPFLKKLTYTDNLKMTYFEKMCAEEVINHCYNNDVQSAAPNCEIAKLPGKMSGHSTLDIQPNNDTTQLTCEKILDTLRIMSKDSHEFRGECEKRLANVENTVSHWSVSPYLRYRSKL